LSKPFLPGFSPSAVNIRVTSDRKASTSAGRPLPLTSSLVSATVFPFPRLATRSSRASSHTGIFEIIVPRLNDSHLAQLPAQQLRFQQIPYQFHQIFARGRAIGERGVAIEIMVIKPLENGFGDRSIKRRNLLILILSVTVDRDQDHVIVAMAVGVVTFSERGLIFILGEAIAVKPMGGAEPIAPGDRHVNRPLFHLVA
jgi:hypothetical protein